MPSRVAGLAGEEGLALQAPEIVRHRDNSTDA